MSKSSIARLQRIGWNTVDRWLEKAGGWCRRFNHLNIRKITVVELQADEIRALGGGGKAAQVWVFAAMEVCSRLWPSTVVHKRTYRNTLDLFQDILARVKSAQIPMIATDGFKFYRQVVKRVFGNAALYGQVIKKRRKDRVVKVVYRTTEPDDSARLGVLAP
ncbi:MAG: hypothetical protein EXQ56_13885 [Acidobacteria bacterium]|nr:hypothetical protein [Acidobacteriota bacterium]